jgi:hypothetical protein
MKRELPVRFREGLGVQLPRATRLVILCNGTEEQAKAMREEVRDFLAHHLRLTLSMEKTKVTHLDDGFDFLGFHLQRGLGLGGVVTKVTIARKALERHRAVLRAATAADSHEDSFATKIPALNRIIRGWCRYFQHAPLAQARFAKLDDETFWRVAHWLGRKHRLSMPSVLARFYIKAKGSPRTLGEGKVRLVKHTSVKYQRYRVRLPKPNPYTTLGVVREREELLDDSPWLGTEKRPGMADLRLLVLERDGYKCRVCKEPVTDATAQVDHVQPVCCFKRPVDANRLGNLWTLCISCHQRKTESDRQMESRMR